MGNHEDPRHAGNGRIWPAQTIVPDVLLQAHSGGAGPGLLSRAAVDGLSAFPADYRGEIFASFHGSWNRTGRTGGKVIACC